jgi:DNA-binding transcriptional LysR family regulator
VVERIMRNELDVGVVSLPTTERQLEVVPLKREPLVAIFSTAVPGLPARITPRFLLEHPLILEYARAQVRALIVDWLSADGQVPRPAMELDNLEAVKRMVASGLGASIVPAAAISDWREELNLAVRPLKPALSRTLGLVHRRDKQPDTAFQHVREALMSLAE